MRTEKTFWFSFFFCNFAKVIVVSDLSDLSDLSDFLFINVVWFFQLSTLN